MTAEPGSGSVPDVPDVPSADRGSTSDGSCGATGQPARTSVLSLRALRALEADLRRVVTGDVRFDPMSRVLYSTDASNYQIEPVGVVHPMDADDVSAAISTCADHKVPVIARAGGSGLAGQAVGAGLIIDVSAHLRQFEIDPERRRASAQPGVVLDELNSAAAVHGLTFGPDPASSDRACIGGIVGNNAAGAHSIVHGMTADHVLGAEVVLADGSHGRLEPMDPGAADRGRTRA
jgi:FAD/FMN-containing dehydrogenase